MRVVRRPAVQGHEIPQTAHNPQGPFPRELFAAPEIVSVEPEPSDTDITAQNLYRSDHLVRCTLCGDVMREDQTRHHTCEH